MIRVMIVEDSLVVRTYLEHIIDRDPRLTLVASVTTAEEALCCLKRVAPDVISLDVRLPKMNGFEATLKIMSERPTPIVIFASDVNEADLNISKNALRAGAVSVLEKPMSAMSKDYEKIADDICDQLVCMSQVKVVRQQSARILQLSESEDFRKIEMFRSSKASIFNEKEFGVLGIVASTGGPTALVKMLSQLPDDFPLPILLVQHITSSFLQGFTTWLSGLCPFDVRIATAGERIEAGRIYMAPVEHHLELVSDRIHLSNADPVSMQRPSGTVLFRSMARNSSSRSIAILMTGMGDDGAEGMKELYEAGGHTIAQDEESCAVYGMPAEAVRLNSVTELLPLERIAQHLTRLVEPKAQKV
ncbi:MAG: chemotaxis-specific protein-glutamate methyltransferase CheB [Oligoflexus sp.]|nr:chemotaxis-specific protein-glutamate methyltransferase CheB [Oligoflexus sp.]